MPRLAKRTRLSVESLESRDNPNSVNLHVNGLTIDKNSGPAVPGAMVTANLDLSNTGMAPLSGKAIVHVYMSTTPDSRQANESLVDIPLPVNLPEVPMTGTMTPVVEHYQIGIKLPDLDPANLKFQSTEASGRQYYFNVQVDPPPSKLPGETPADNTGYTASPFDYSFKFGKVGTRNNVALMAVSGGNETKFTMDQNGTGTGTLSVANGAVDLDVTGGLVVTAALAKPASKGTFPLGNVTARTALLKFLMPTVDTTGTVNFEKGVVSLKLHDVSGPALTIADTLTPQGNSVASTLELHKVTGTNVSVAGGLSKFSANEWDAPAGGGPGGLLSARFIENLNITQGNGLNGDFAGGIGITGPAPDGQPGLGEVHIHGAVRNSTWTVGVAGVGNPINVGDVYIGGGAQDWRLTATGDVTRLDLTGDYLNTDTAVTALEARYFGDVFLKGNVSIGFIQADGSKSGDVAINHLAMTKVSKLARLTALDGGIGWLNAGSWPDTGVVETKWIRTLSTTDSPAAPAGGGAPTGGEFAAQLVLSGVRPGSATSLSSASFSGALQGLFQAFGDVDRVTAGSIDEWLFAGGVGFGSAGTILGDLEVLKTGDAAKLTVRTDAIGTIKVGGLLRDSSIAADMPIPVKLVKAGGLANTTLQADPGSGFQSIETNQVSNDSITAGYVTSLRVTKGTSRDGSLTNLNVTLESSPTGKATDPQGVTRLVQADGPVQDLTWSAPDGYVISRIQAPSWDGGAVKDQVNAGRIDTLQLTGKLTNVRFALHDPRTSLGTLNVGGQVADSGFILTGGATSFTAASMYNSTFTAPGTVGTFLVGRPSGGQSQFNETIVTAGSMGRVVIVSVDPGFGNGITADKIQSYTRYEGRQPVKQLRNLDAPDPQADVAGGYTLKII